jgi:hypothetical protein
MARAWIVTMIVIGLLVLETIVQFYQAYWTAWLGQAVTFDLRTAAVHAHHPLQAALLRQARPIGRWSHA